MLSHKTRWIYRRDADHCFVRSSKFGFSYLWRKQKGKIFHMRTLTITLLLGLIGVGCSDGEYPANTGTGAGLTTTEAATSDMLTSDAESGGTRIECDPANGAMQEVCMAKEGVPYCSATGECVSCSAMEKSCIEIDLSFPVCSENGACVECKPEESAACAGETEICDPETSACRLKCDQHEDCGERACDFSTGLCFPTALVRSVNKNDAQCQKTSDAPEVPFCELGQAIIWANAQTQGAKITINMISASTDIVPITINEGREVAILAKEDANISLHANGMAIIRVKPTSKLLIQGVKLMNNLNGAGLMCEQGQLWVDQTMSVGNQKQGIWAQGCEVIVRRSILGKNMNAGIIATGATNLVIENSFISNNGNIDGFASIALREGSSASVIYSSVVDNLSTPGTPFGVSCDEDVTKKEVFNIRNSLFLNKGYNTIDFTGCKSTVVTTAYSALPENLVEGQGNVAISWDDFAELVVVDNENPWIFRTQSDSILRNLGIWHTGDPEVDFDGHPRLAIEGAQDFVGAALE